MPFFDELPPPPPPEQELENRPPPWLAPPDNYIGGLVDLRLEIARTPDVAVALEGMIAYPSGFECRITVRKRKPKMDMHPEFFWHFPGATQSLDEILKFGLVFPDGSKVTNPDRSALLAERGNPPSGPTMIPLGGGGGGHTWTQSVWMWPMPGAGTMAVYLEWKAQGIDEIRVEVSTDRLLTAAAEAIELWPDAEGIGIQSVQGSIWSISSGTNGGSVT